MLANSVRFLSVIASAKDNANKTWYFSRRFALLYRVPSVERFCDPETSRMVGAGQKKASRPHVSIQLP